MNAIGLSIFANRIEAVCEEMGATLQKTAFSPNIRDRLDYSCAVFDASGELCAQAAHIPVHLGSMAYAMRDIVSDIEWHDGDMVILNDPFKGGTHLPDVTLIMPVYSNDELQGFVANRAHHADIGSETPGSMPLSSCLQEEGIIISPCHLLKRGELDKTQFEVIMTVMRNREQSEGDFNAQIAANQIGQKRLAELITKMGYIAYQKALLALNDYAEQLARVSYRQIPDGEYCFEDILDDDGLGEKDIKIAVMIKVVSGEVFVDFDGTANQVAGNVNSPLSVTAAAVYYVFRCLLPSHAPACVGSFRGIRVSAPQKTIVNAAFPSAVAAGNVETSTRIVDVILGALAKALPEKIPAASHGSMNNLAMGSKQHGWDYYETIGGGSGANSFSDGIDAVHTHMTNTLNTPVESLEMNYPLRINRYAVRKNSGGAGKRSGGNGIVREYAFLDDAEFTLLTERRTHSPWGLNQGQHAEKGVNRLNGELLKGKISCHVKASDILLIETPGGGGFG